MGRAATAFETLSTTWVRRIWQVTCHVRVIDPADSDDEALLRPFPEPIRSLSTKMVEGNPHNLGPSTPRLLVVDDTEMVRKLIRAVLKEVPVEIIEAGNGRDALATAAKSEFALVILDIMMPEMNGIEVARQLRSQPATERLPILFCTAASDRGIVLSAAKLGNVDYILKPINRQMLLAKVQDMLRHATGAGVGCR